jgi:addiction module HigA family antidote
MATKKTLDPIHPGEILLEEFMVPLDISINRLARNIDVPPGRIGAIVNGRRAITADTALRLAKYFGTSSELWIGFQGEFDLRVVKRQIGREIEKRIQKHMA